MRRHRNVKIVATLGPASDDYETIKALHLAGADVFRLNMSHGSHDDIAKRHNTIRKIEEELNSPIGILADLQGPKLRVGRFKNESEILVEGQEFRLDLKTDLGTSKRVSLPHPEIFAALTIGSILLVNDGKIKLEVTAFSKDSADCIVRAGGIISDRKGVNVPDVILPLAALSQKDRTDLEFACGLGIDWLALSFVQRPEDVMEARELAKGRAAILSKIEKPAALAKFDDILKSSDGIMVARGDLGVELPVQNVPPVQKRLVRACRAAANEGADAIMLSAESAAGLYPVDAVQTMDNVAIEVESDPTYREIIEASRNARRNSVADGIVSAAREIAETTDIKAISCYTQSGTTALLIAREKPCVPIVAMTSEIETARRLSLTWGTNTVMSGAKQRFKEAVVSAVRGALSEGYASENDQIVITAGVPFNIPGTTNILRVAPCNERMIYSMDPE